MAQAEIAEGVITFKQTMSSDNDNMNTQFAMMGELLTTTYFKNDKSRTELSNPMTGDVITIFDTENGQMMMAMDNPMMGKVYSTKPFSDIVGKNEGVEIKKGTDTKTVLGYECQQYTFSMSQDGVNVKMIMYTTPKIKAVKKETLEFLGDFDGGYPLYVDIQTQTQGISMNIIQEATSINAQEVEDSKFDLTPPEGYQKVDTIPGM
jgi:hypothetical protein